MGNRVSASEVLYNNFTQNVAGEQKIPKKKLQIFSKDLINLRKIELGRKITVENIGSRLNEDERRHLIYSFDRLERDGLIDKYQFRNEVLGVQVPEVIAERIFCSFASQISVESQAMLSKIGKSALSPSTIGNQGVAGPQVDGMSFEDLIMCYIVFSQQRTDEFAQLCFEMLKLSKDQAQIERDDLVHFCKRIAQLDENYVNLYYKRTGFDPRIPISRDEFLEKFELVKDFSLFTLMVDVACGFKPEYLNLTKRSDDASLSLMAKSYALSEIQMKKSAETAESEMGLLPDEMDSVQEFFDEEIRGRDAAHVLTIYRRLLGQISDDRVRITLISKISKHKGNDFEFFHKLASVCIKKTALETRLNFIFDLFADGSSMITPLQFDELCTTFAIENVKPKKSNMTQMIFRSELEHVEFDPGVYLSQARFVFIAMVGVKGESTHKEEQQAIMSFLGQQHLTKEGDQQITLDLESYITSHLDSEDTLYVIEQAFWNEWIQISEQFTPRKQIRQLIDNKKLLEAGHVARLKEDKILNHDFVVVPKYVFKPLSKWYECNQVLERIVDSRKTFNTIKRMKKNEGLRASVNVSMAKDTAAGPLAGRPIFSPTANPQAQGAKIFDEASVQNGGEALSVNSEKKNLDFNQMATGVTTTHKPFKDYTKTVGDTQYDLEVYPKVIYFQRVEKDGKRPFENQIKSLMVQKLPEQEKIPFHELSITKRATLDVILKYFTEVFKETNPKKARLLIDNQVISGLRLTQTLEEYPVRHGTVVYVEFLLPNNTWPTDNLKELERKNETSKGEGGLNTEHGEAVGLYNLGNTCYINSAMQCIVNLKPMYDYFVQERLYLQHLNLEAALGYKGDLALAFANLMQQMWQANSVVVPRGFKHTLGKLREQFAGDEQQDSQEYVNFLIDGLHEEINLRRSKPYIANPESDDRELMELALESWSNSLRRDWSFIFFLFYGQMKSTLECLTCEKESTTFDLFTNIPVSLPEPSQLLLNIIVHRLPTTVKSLLRNEEAEEQAREAGEEDLSQNYTSLTNDQPIHISLKVDKQITIQELQEKILAIQEVNVKKIGLGRQYFNELVLYSVNMGAVRGLFEPANKLTHYKLLTNEIVAQEMLTPLGKQFIKLRYQQDADLHRWTNSLLYGLTLDDVCEDVNPSKNKEKKKEKDNAQPYTHIFIFNNYALACEKFALLVHYNKIPPTLMVVAYHRRFAQKQNRPFLKYQPQLISSPIILQLPAKPTGHRIYEEVWALAQVVLKRSSSYLQSYENLWWNQPEWRETLKNGKDGSIKPFVLKMVDRQGYSCSQCNWIQRCSGCVIEPSSELIPDFLKKCHIAIEWNSALIEEEYNPTSAEIMRHPSIYEHDDDVEDQIVSLERCIDKFHDIEKLTDETYCSKCAAHRTHQKSFQIFRPPPVLTIQLKRFKQIGTRWRKQQTLVEFPLYNFDLSNHVQDYQFLTTQDISCQYDLVGVINHFGSLTYGHYTATVKNPFNNFWYRYDDQSRTRIPESQIPKENAYILFYQRKDLSHKGLREVFPPITRLFPGKPVTTKYGEGFVLGPKAPGFHGTDERSSSELDKRKYYVKIGEDIHEVREELIKPDKDLKENTGINHDQLESIAQRQSMHESDVEASVGMRIRNFLLCGLKQKADVTIQNEAAQTRALLGQSSTADQNSEDADRGASAIHEVGSPVKPVSRVNQVHDNKVDRLPLIDADMDIGDDGSNTKVRKKKKKKKKNGDNEGIVNVADLNK